MGNLVDQMIQRQRERLDPIADVVQGAVASALDAVGEPVADVLHGKWLGHPLHAALTDVPIGAWTISTILDAISLRSGDRRIARCADNALGIGILGATSAAVAGLADWRWVNDQPRRVGLIHAIFNSTALTLNAVSLGLRLSRKRQTGLVMSTLGYAAVLGGAWLGGKLSYSYGIGVDHTAFQSGPDQFVPVIDETALPEGRLCRVMANGRPILLYRHGQQVSAIAETCAHAGGPLAEGRLVDGNVVCPWHGSTYALEDGRLVNGPSVYDQPAFDTRIRSGKIEVRLTSSPASTEREILHATIPTVPQPPGRAAASEEPFGYEPQPGSEAAGPGGR